MVEFNRAKMCWITWVVLKRAVWVFWKIIRLINNLTAHFFLRLFLILDFLPSPSLTFSAFWTEDFSDQHPGSYIFSNFLYFSDKCSRKNFAHDQGVIRIMPYSTWSSISRRFDFGIWNFFFTIKLIWILLKSKGLSG